MPPSTRSSKAAGIPWTQATLAPVVLVAGAEIVLAERAIGTLVSSAREHDADVEITRFEAAVYEAGSLATLASPSLFGESRIIIVRGVESTNDAFLTDALDYLEAPMPDVWLVLQHGGGVRGKRLLEGVRAKKFPVVSCEPLKRDSEKADFVVGEFRRASRRIESDATRALVEAVGNDMPELAAACTQLISDTEGLVTAATVNEYHGGRVEANSFRVADAALAGRTAEAMELLRHALATGADPVPLVAALAAKARTLAKVAAVRGQKGAAKELGLAPWQIDKARRELAGWTPEGLATAITAIAAADAQVKGAGRDPVFAVEKAVLTVAGAYGRTQP